MWKPAALLWKAARISDNLEARVAATARFTVAVAVITAVGVSAYSVSSLLTAPASSNTYVAAAVFLAGTAVAFLLVRFGKIWLGAHVIVLACWSAGTYFLLVEGPRTAHLGIYFVAIIAAGLLTRPLAAILYGLASAAAVLLVSSMVELGYHTPAPIPDGAWTNVVAQLLVVGGLTALLVRGLQGAFADLSKSERRLATLVDNSPDGIVLLDADGRCLEINPAARALLELDADVAQDRAASADAIRSVGFDPLAFEDGAWVTNVGAGDERRVLEVNAIRWGEPEEASAGYELILRDITSREQDYAERRRLEANLLRSQKTEALGRLAGGVAHDFNNLLTVILTNASPRASAAGWDERHRERFEEIHEAGQKAAAITRQLLIFGSKVASEVRSVDVREVVHGMERMARRLLGERITLEVSMGEAPLMVRADPVLLEQVLVNLVVNAHDAMPTGGRLSIEARVAHEDQSTETARARRWAVLRVTDTGTGMSELDRARAFEPFFSTKPEGQGTGLGLSTASLIVKELDGDIGIESVIGEGTTVTVRLPLHEGGEPERASVARGGAPATGAEELLCVVDDDRGVLRVVQRILEANGYRVIAGYDWEAVEEQLDREPIEPRLLVTDVVLRGSSGVDVARAFRARCGNRPVLFMSGYAGGVLEGYGMNEQTELLPKPFSTSDLLRQIGRLLGDSPDGDP